MCFKMIYNTFIFSKFEIFSKSCSGAIGEPFCFLNFVIRMCEYHEVVKNSSVTAVTSVSVYLLVFHFSL